MARNKHPEETVERILQTAKGLFLEKGYEQTTIQDIVNQLGGLTKGAVYHHFRSKEEIFDALGDKLFFDSNPFDAVRERRDLTALQKVREVIRLHAANGEYRELTLQGMPLLKNPRILSNMIDANRRLISPLWLELIAEGQRDGSIPTPYPKELSELMPLLTNLYLNPDLFPADAGELSRRFRCICAMLSALGLPLLDSELEQLSEQYFLQLYEGSRQAD